MLTQEDLKNIGVELGKVIEQNITPTLEQMATKEDLKKMGTKEDLSSLQKQVDHIENQMVTKSYLDEKLLDLRGDLTILMRKEDTKVLRLVECLKEKNVLNESEVQDILAMEPFPRLA